VALGNTGAIALFFYMIDTAPEVFIPKFAPKEDKAWWDKMLRQVIQGEGVEKLRERQEMKAIAQAEQKTQRKTVNGLGQLKAIIPETTYLRWHLAERGCWNDKQFRREFYRDNPELLASRPEKKYY
jgi:hypothetical protein